MNLVKYYNDNISSIYSRIQTLYQQGQQAFDSSIEVPKLKLLSVPKSNSGEIKLNRAVYLWTLDCIKQLQEAINDLIVVYNDAGVIDYDAGDTEELTLWIPERLAVDDIYIAKLSDNFEQCNKVLDNLLKYLQSYTTGY